MAAVTTFPVYDPWSKDAPAAEHLSELRSYNQRIYALVKSVVERNKAAGKKGKDIFTVCGIHRRDGFHVFFYLAMQISKYEIYPLDEGAPQYEGALTAAEALMDGRYRIASLEEEAECKQRDVEAHNAKMAQREKIGTMQAAALMSGLAARVMGPVTPSPALAGGKRK